MRRAAPVALLIGVLVLGLATLAGAARPERGIDVSRFQGKIKWQKVGGDGIDFAFVQASRGSGQDCAVAPDDCGADGQYERNYAGARDAGIHVGAYHRAFAGGGGRKRTQRDARKEARVFVEIVGSLGDGDLFPALDLETPFGGLSPKELRRWVRVWLDRVQHKLGEKPLIYTNTTSWNATGDTRKFARAGHPLWVANWGVKKPSVPAGNWDGKGWSVWQHTSSGRVKGINGRVDLNRLKVDLSRISAR
jgi:lysozyme